MSTQAFWIAEENNLFRPTIHTQGPWNPQFQHGGPPAALLVRQMEQCSPKPDMILARVTVEILSPIPLTPLHSYARITRPGRSVERLEAFLELDGRLLAHASGWRIRVSTAQPDVTEADKAPGLPAEETSMASAPEWYCGFLAATEWRFVHGGYTLAGDACAWVRLRYPLIAGEEITPTQRLMVSADSANGISSSLDIRDWRFVPPELTVHCLRPPIGEWIYLDARTHLSTEGVGLATADLYDPRGLVGRSAQALFITHNA